MFGSTAASAIARTSLDKIIEIGELLCKFCAGAFSRTHPEQSREKVCEGISHHLAQITSVCYVDDYVFGSKNNFTLDRIIDYAIHLFALFSYEFKGIDCNNQPFKGESDTVDAQGNMSVCGYIWNPSSDLMSLKKIALHNGVMHRGKITKVKSSKVGETSDLRIQVLNCKEKITLENINKLLEGKNKTLRVLISLCAQHYDPLGLANACLAQTRNTVSLAMKNSLGQWDEPVNEDIWNFFIAQMIELWLCSLHKYSRFPPSACSNPASTTLLVLSDASLSIILHCFLILSPHTQAKQNEGKRQPEWTPNIVNFLSHRSFLSSEITHIPQRELQGLSLGSQMLKQIVSELGISLKKIILGVDAKVAIWWSISNNTEKMSIFVANRSTIIKNELNQASQLLYDLHVSEGLDNVITQNPPPP